MSIPAEAQEGSNKFQSLGVVAKEVECSQREKWKNIAVSSVHIFSLSAVTAGAGGMAVPEKAKGWKGWTPL